MSVSNFIQNIFSISDYGEIHRENISSPKE